MNVQHFEVRGSQVFLETDWADRGFYSDSVSCQDEKDEDYFGKSDEFGVDLE